MATYLSQGPHRAFYAGFAHDGVRMSPAGMRRLVEARAVLDAACLMLRALEVIV